MMLSKTMKMLIGQKENHEKKGAKTSQNLGLLSIGVVLIEKLKIGRLKFHIYFQDFLNDSSVGYTA